MNLAILKSETDHALRHRHREGERQLLCLRTGFTGLYSTGNTVEEAEVQIREAIRFHLEGLKEDNLPIPEPTSICDYVET